MGMSFGLGILTIFAVTILLMSLFTVVLRKKTDWTNRRVGVTSVLAVLAIYCVPWIWMTYSIAEDEAGSVDGMGAAILTVFGFFFLAGAAFVYWLTGHMILTYLDRK